MRFENNLLLHFLSDVKGKHLVRAAQKLNGSFCLHSIVQKHLYMFPMKAVQKTNQANVKLLRTSLLAAMFVVTLRKKPSFL